jgi:hypothetical protein
MTIAAAGVGAAVAMMIIVVAVEGNTTVGIGTTIEVTVVTEVDMPGIMSVGDVGVMMRGDTK